MSYIDLHVHSNASSDGEFSPEELIAIAIKAGVKVMAIADHNTIKVTKVAQNLLSSHKEASAVDIIPAVELDCTYKGVDLHVLGLWIDVEDPEFLQIEEQVFWQEQKTLTQRIDKIRALGIHVDLAKVEALAKGGIVTGEMIVETALADDKNHDNSLLSPYRISGKSDLGLMPGSRSDSPMANFYWDYCAQGKLAYVPMTFISLAEAVALIRRGGGVPVLAHPGNNIKENASLLQEIHQQGVAGLEVYSSYHTSDQIQFYKEQAQLLGMAISCGSDFHGKVKPRITMGSMDCENQEEAILQDLLAVCGQGIDHEK